MISTTLGNNYLCDRWRHDMDHANSRSLSNINHREPTTTLRPQSVTDTRLRGLRIVLAEDSPDNQVLFRWYLEKSSAQVTVANDGAEAVHLISECIMRGDTVDLVLMDIQMPNVDGYEATRRLRAAGFTRPILAITAHALDHDLPPILNAGCDGRITKPVTHHELVDRILKSLGVAGN